MRKAINSSERQRGKSIAVSGLKEYEETLNSRLIFELRHEMEMKYANICYMEEMLGPTKHLENILIKLEIGHFQLYKCRCPNPDRMTDEEILKASGFNESQFDFSLVGD